jgi:hypothetical protein
MRKQITDATPETLFIQVQQAAQILMVTHIIIVLPQLPSVGGTKIPIVVF